MNGSDKYQMFKLLGNEFTFDVDVSKLGCGLNGALYFVSMDEDGGKSKYSTNKAGRSGREGEVKRGGGPRGALRVLTRGRPRRQVRHGLL